MANRCIVLFVEDVPFLAFELYLLVLGKRLKGLDWVIWCQAVTFTLSNMIRHMRGFYRTQHRISPAERVTDSVAVVQVTAQVIAS